MKNIENSHQTYGDVFRGVYYSLYSNSRASRAETIVSDISNLLLCKVASDRGGATEIEDFKAGRLSSSDLMISIKKRFPNLIRDGDRFQIEDVALRSALSELDKVSFLSAPAHVLGDAFEGLIGPRLRGDKGQFFTPRSLVRAMIKIASPVTKAKIVDPACGTGGFLAEAFGASDLSAPEQLIGIEKDGDLAKLAESMIELVAPNRGAILNMNSLDIESLLQLPAQHSPFNADAVLTNPPFGSKIKVTDKKILRQYKLGHRWVRNGTQWQISDHVLDGQDPQILFIELGIRLLKSRGTLAIVLPEGVFGNKGLSYVWSFLAEEGSVEALVDCPRTTFQPGTDTKTNVLVFKKGVKETKERAAWLAVAHTCGHDRRGRSSTADGQPYPDDFKTIGNAYASKSAPWQRVELRKRDYLVPRYYDRLAVQNTGRRTVSLGELVRCGALTLSKGHEVGAEAYGTGDIPFVRTSDVSNYEVSIDPTKCVSDDIYEKYRYQQNLRSGDILMISDGRYRIGRTAILTEATSKCVVQSHLKIISVSEKSEFSNYEVLYLLNLPSVQEQIRNLVFIQSTLGSLGSRISEIRLPLPDKGDEWARKISRFKSIIETRASLLLEISQFEHGDLEL